MEDVNRAYQILGVTPTMSLEEIETIYDELLKKYEPLSVENMYYKEKIEQWTEAFDCIVDDRIDMTSSVSSVKTVKRYGVAMLVMMSVIAVIFFTSFAIWNITKDTTSQVVFNEATDISTLSNNFKLSLSKFDETEDWDWGYYEDGNQWTVVVAIEVSNASEEGALINAYNFRLDGTYPTTLISQDIYSDATLKQVHYLGEYSELIPLNQKFGIVFTVEAFMHGEERVLYYYHPDGSKHEVGRLIYETMDATDERGIFI